VLRLRWLTTGSDPLTAEGFALSATSVAADAARLAVSRPLCWRRAEASGRLLWRTLQSEGREVKRCCCIGAWVRIGLLETQASMQLRCKGGQLSGFQLETRSSSAHVRVSFGGPDHPTQADRTQEQNARTWLAVAWPRRRSARGCQRSQGHVRCSAARIVAPGFPAAASPQLRSRVEQQPQEQQLPPETPSTQTWWSWEPVRRPAQTSEAQWRPCASGAALEAHCCA
jgi:hypothetical protein